MEWALLPFKRYADFEGRSSRKEYWLYTLFIWVVGVTLLLLGSFVGAGMTGTVFILLLILGIMAAIVPSVAVAVRRLHDQDKSGWLMLIQLISTVGPLIVFVWMLLPGTDGDNRFGLDPKRNYPQELADRFS